MKVTSREGRVSRNGKHATAATIGAVTSREGRVSRNILDATETICTAVTSREGRVSRNGIVTRLAQDEQRHVPRGTCE